MKARSIVLQVPAYALFAALVGYFSSAPPYHALGPGEAVVKLSFTHAGERREPCRERSAEELQALAPNMRAKLDCPRERSDIRVEVEMDGRVIYAVRSRASGLRRDLPSVVYRRAHVPAGEHVFRARMADDASGAFRHRGEAKVRLAPGGLLVIDFAPAAGGFTFRS